MYNNWNPQQNYYYSQSRYQPAVPQVPQMQPIPQQPSQKTVAEIAKNFKNNIIIIRVEGHLTCSIYGAVADIWYCNDEIVDRFWIVQR